MNVIGFAFLLLPYLLGVAPVFLARTAPGKIVAKEFGLVSVAFGVVFTWGVVRSFNNTPSPNIDIPIIGGLVTGLTSVIVTFLVDKTQSPRPIVTKQRKRVLRNRVLIALGVVAVAIVAVFYFRAPHFSGSTVTSIDIKMTTPPLPEGTSTILVQGVITNVAACEGILTLLRSARIHMDHKCADLGTFTIQYSNGKKDSLAFLPGHDPRSYEFRFGYGSYWLPRDRFFGALRRGGIDTAKMPEEDR